MTGIAFDMDRDGNIVALRMPWWWVPWAFIFWSDDLAPIVRRIFYAWLRGKRALVR